MVLNVLLTIYVCLTVLDFFFMVSLHYLHNRRGYYKTAAFVWVGIFLSFGTDGVVTAAGWDVQHLVAIPLISITMFALSKLVADIYEVAVPYRRFLYFSAGTWLAGCFLHFALKAPFMLSSAVVCGGVVAPVLYTAVKFFRNQRGRMHIIDRFFGILIVAEAVHILDYPFLRPIPGAAVFGFSFALMLVYFASMLIPVVINRRLSDEANRAKSLFLANMSHELRTPMHGILSYARFGQQKIDSVPKEKLKGYFDEIHESGSRLMHLLNDLLDLSKLEAGKVDYSMARHDLAEAVEVVRSEMSAYAAEKKLTISVHTHISDATAHFDRERIMQVLRNLVSNAIKFSHGGTTIRVDILTAPDGQLQCVVANHGVGIPQGELEKVFDKFVQSSKTRTGAGGTGLGLAICREIIAQHKGRIWAESAPDGLTKFTFRIPGRRPE